MMQFETKHNRIIAGAGEYLAVCIKNGQYKKTAIKSFFFCIGLNVCNHCKTLKQLDDFHKNKISSNGLCKKCKDCTAIFRNEYYKKNKDQILIKCKLYYNNKTEKRKEYKKLYREKNKNKISEYHNSYIKSRSKSDSLFKLKTRIRSRISDSIRLSGYTKKSRTHEILGCDFEFFKQHIERQFLPGMTWEKLGSEIHIDHITPLASATTEEEVIALNHFTNLRPCWAVENLRKSDNIEFLI